MMIISSQHYCFVKSFSFPPFFSSRPSMPGLRAILRDARGLFWLMLLLLRYIAFSLFPLHIESHYVRLLSVFLMFEERYELFYIWYLVICFRLISERRRLPADAPSQRSRSLLLMRDIRLFQMIYHLYFMRYDEEYRYFSRLWPFIYILWVPISARLRFSYPHCHCRRDDAFIFV